MTSNYLYGGNVQANGIRQHYMLFSAQNDQTKKSLPVVLLPGITSPAITWAFVAERLAEYNDIYVLDIRGRGLSESCEGMDYSVDAQADDVIAFAKALNLGSFCLIGHSMGARIATRALARGADDVAKLVMVDPPVSGPGRREYPSKLPWYMDSIALAEKGMDADAMKEFCPTWTDEQLKLRAEWLHTCDPVAIKRSFDDFHEDDFHKDLPAVKIPSLLMRAGKGDVILEEDVAEMKGLIPELDVRMVEAAGHMIPWDDEEGFYTALGDFLYTA